MSNNSGLEKPIVKTEVVKGEYRLSRERLETFLEDLRWEQNEWRFVADREADYYDSKQLDAEILTLMEERGIPPLVRNIIAPTIDSILGMEAQNRRDLKVIPEFEDKEAKETAIALDEEFKRAQRLCRMDRAVSDAFKGQVGVGIGWVGVSRPLDPFLPPYSVKHVPRREMFWDMRAVEPDLSDARFMVRKKWYDQDMLTQVFPKFAAVIDHAGNMWSDFDYDTYHGSPYWQTSQLLTAYSQYVATNLEAMEWIDTTRRRMQLYEVWYKVYTRAKVLRYQDVVVEFDPKNPAQKAALQMGGIIENTLVPKIRLAYWVGPHQILDIPSPYPHNRYPYVPFFGMREDRTNIPYGLIRRFMSPQDEVNARLSRMMWLLSAKRVMADADAFADEFDEVMEEVNRPDAGIRLNPNRRNPRDKPEIVTDHQLARDQFEVMRDAEDYVAHRGANTHPSFQGQNDSGVRSQTHSTQLIEQTTMGLAEIMDNLSYSRRLVGEQLLSLVKQDIGRGPRDIEVVRHGKRMVISLNTPMQDDSGFSYRSNDIARVRTIIGLEEVPKTRTYRQQQFAAMSEIIKSLSDDPEVQRAVLDIWMRYSDISESEELANRISAITGYGDEDDPERAAQRQAEAEQEQAAAEAELRDLIATADKKAAESRLTLAKIEEIGAKVAKLVNDAAMDKQEFKLQQRAQEHEEVVDMKELEIKKKQAEKPQPAAAPKAKPKPKGKK